jgi:nitroreductase
VEFKEVVGRRRSIRFFQPWRPVEREKVQTILEAARLASRAVNAPFVNAIVVDRESLPEEDREALKTPTTTAQLDLAPTWIFWFADLDAVNKTNKGETLRQLVDVGALAPSHGWSHSYVDDVVWAQVLRPLREDPAVLTFLCSVEASIAMSQAQLAAVDEGLGTTFTSVNPVAVKRVLQTPDTLLLIYAQLVGYPAESPDGGGQRPREPFENCYHEGRYGTPFRRDEAVVDRLRQEGMLTDAAPAPWRQSELRGLARMFGLPE